jgi:hypothetical protein
LNILGDLTKIDVDQSPLLLYFQNHLEDLIATD